MGEVAAVWSIASRELCDFGAPPPTTAITMQTLPRSGDSRGSAYASSLVDPACMRTKPPNTERAAEPEPRRARIDSSRGDSSRPAARAAAAASAANPDADDASPDAVGKLLRERTRARIGMPACARIEIEERGEPLHVPGGRGRAVEHELVALERRVELHGGLGGERGERERRLPAAGRFKSASRLPQYLTSAMFAHARAVTASIGAHHTVFSPGRRGTGR